MRGAIPFHVPVCNHRQQYIRIVDMPRFDKDEIPAGERSLVGRFGYFYVIWKILLTRSFVGFRAGCILTIFFDLFVSAIRGPAYKQKGDFEADTLFFPTSGHWPICLLSFR